MANNSLIICGAICFLVFALPLGIASIAISQHYDSQCDIIDTMGLNISAYLLIGGIASVCVSVLLALFGVIGFLKNNATCIWIVGFIAVINALFGLAWFIVGAIILFRSNLECIRQGSTPVIYALVLWCLSATSAFIIR